MTSEVRTASIRVDGIDVFHRRSSGEGTPVVLVHGNPTHSGDWVPFMRRLRRPALAIDLPGWGMTRAPAGFRASMDALAGFLGRALTALGVERHRLVVHDWGSLALIEAIRDPRRVERLAVINAVPLLAGYRWHWIARWFWRRRGLGELVNLLVTKPGVRLLTRPASAAPGPMPDEFVDAVWAGWQRGIRRPMLELYRSADPQRLAEAGRGLASLSCPALVVWGLRDPYIPPRFGRAYAGCLPDCELVELPDAGHWPWFERPDVISLVSAFVDG